jgi:hypothetical protein
LSVLRDPVEEHAGATDRHGVRAENSPADPY